MARFWQGLGRDVSGLKSWLGLAVGVFVIAMLAAMLVTRGQLDAAQMIFAGLAQGLSEVGEVALEGPALTGALVIFANNMLTTVLAIVLSPVIGLFALFVLLLNGGLLGFLAVLLQAEGMPLWQFFLVGILPHGILELPAVFLAAGLGLRMGWQVLFPPPGADRGEALGQNLLTGLRLLPLLVLLLAVAALVEVLITPHLLEQLGH